MSTDVLNYEYIAASLQEIIDLDWRRLPVGSKDTLIDRLEIVDVYLTVNTEALMRETQRMISLSIDSDTEEERKNFIMWQWRFQKALGAKRTLEKEIKRRGGVK